MYKNESKSINFFHLIYSHCACVICVIAAVSYCLIEIHGYTSYPEELINNCTAALFVHYSIRNKETVDVNVRVNLCEMFSNNRHAGICT